VTRRLFLAAAVLPLALLAGCGKIERSPATAYLVGFSQANLTEPWRIAMTEEVKQEASHYSDMRVIYADAGDSTTRQVDDVQRLMDYGIDLLIISPTDAHALTPIVRASYSKIPVIVLDRAVEGYDYSLFIGPDNERLGREAGVVASEMLGKRSGTVLEIQGRSGSPPTLARSEGFREVLVKHPNVKLLHPLVADWLRDTAEDKLARRMRSLPDIDVVFAQNDAMALGAWRAVNAAGRTGIRFIGIDGLPGPTGGIELVKAGVLSATFTCPTGGKEAVTYGRDLLQRKEGIPKRIFLRPSKVTPDFIARSEKGVPYRRRVPIAEGRRIVMGFAQVGSESEWRVANTKSIKTAAAKAGIDLIFEDGKQQQSKQIDAIRSFIRKKVDVIAFSPIVESGWEEVLREARDAGIPVILSDRSVDLKDDSLWLTFMGSDFTEEGRRAARWLIENRKKPGQINIVELQGTNGSAPAIERRIGFEEVIKGHSDFKIVISEGADFTIAQGYDVMKSILSRPHPRIDAIFAHNDDMAIGAIKAMEEVGLRPGKDISVVSIDAAHLAFTAMIDGKLSCSVECNPLLGPQLMKAVQDYMNGKDLPIRMITSEGIFPAKTALRDMSGREY
jgi:simple sugar transport system substrate-binding protein